MKIAIILGTRPEIIKFSPIIRELSQNNIEYFIIHTNQHYSENLDKIFFQQFDIKQPEYNLNIGSHTQGKQVGLMLEKIEQVLMSNQPGLVMVQGDTNSGLAGALAAVKLQLKVVHIEAGLRSYDKRMPEEINRKLIDHMADLLFAPAKLQKEILLSEGISHEKICVVGNTIVDALQQNLVLSRKNRVLNQYKLEKNNYFLLTFHRAENSNKENLETIVKSMKKIYKKYKTQIFFPIHPRTRNLLELFRIEIPSGLQLEEPLGYLPFLQLMENARLIFTDSGGIQEEACILKIPCISLRDNTERPETIEVNANIIAGIDFVNIEQAIDKSLAKSTNWENPFGEQVSANIIKNLKGHLCM